MLAAVTPGQSPSTVNNGSDNASNPQRIDRKGAFRATLGVDSFYSNPHLLVHEIRKVASGVVVVLSTSVEFRAVAVGVGGRRLSSEWATAITGTADRGSVTVGPSWNFWMRRIGRRTERAITASGKLVQLLVAGD
jgi:hypothetical protein